MKTKLQIFLPAAWLFRNDIPAGRVSVAVLSSLLLFCFLAPIAAQTAYEFQPVALAPAYLTASAAANGNCAMPVLSADGRYAVFVSQAGNLTTNDNSARYLQVFLRDLNAQTTRLLSLSTNPAFAGNGDSNYPQISTNGEWVVFESFASNLVKNDNNNSRDVFAYQVSQERLVVVSQGTNSATGNPALPLPYGADAFDRGRSFNAVLSGDGRTVVFQSQAVNLVPGRSYSPSDLYVRDLANNITTRGTAGSQGTSYSVTDSYFAPALTDDGRWLAFQSINNMIQKSGPMNTNIYLRDLWLDSFTLLTLSTNQLMKANGMSFNPAISPDGRYIAFYTSARDLAPGPYPANYGGGLAIHDLASHASQMAALFGGYGRYPGFLRFNTFFGADGRFLIYDGYTNNAGYVSVRDLAARQTIWNNALSNAPMNWFSENGRYTVFCTTTNSLQYWWHDLAGARTLALTNIPASALICSISADGQRIAYANANTGALTNANPNLDNVYLYDLANSQTTCISAPLEQTVAPPRQLASSPAKNGVSLDGRWLIFTAMEDGFSASDTNGFADIYRRDLRNGANQLISVAWDGVSAASGPSQDPVLSANGQVAAFLSTATNLTSDAPTLVRQTELFTGLFVRDLASGVTRLLAAAATNSFNHALSPDGRLLAYAFRDQYTNKLAVVDWAANTNVWTLANDDRGVSYAFSFSADNRLLVFESTRTDLVHATIPGSSGTDRRNIYARDLARSTNELISVRKPPMASTYAGNRPSWGPLLSQDGRYVYFQSSATDLATNAMFSGVAYPNLFRRDRVRQMTELVSVTWNNVGSRSTTDLTPSISFDGRWAAFSCNDDTMVFGDTNRATDVFLRDMFWGVTSLASYGQSGLSAGNAGSDFPCLSADGRFMLFRSKATNLVANTPTNDFGNLFLYETATQQRRLLPSGLSSDAALSSLACSANGAAFILSLALAEMMPSGAGLVKNTRYWHDNAAPILPDDPAIPWIAAPPQNQTIAVGSRCRLSVYATGRPPLAYQWRKNGQPIAGATNAALEILSVALGDSGQYGVQITNASGAVEAQPARLVVVQPLAATFAELPSAVTTTYGPGSASVSGKVLGGTNNPSGLVTATVAGATYTGGVNAASGRFSITTYFGTLPAGDYTILLAYQGDMLFAKATNSTIRLSVKPAPLTIIAEEKTRGIHQPNPVFTAVLEGLVNTDGPEVLQPPIQYATLATLHSPMGTYPIVPFGATASNYSITFVAGQLHIEEMLSVPHFNQVVLWGGDPSLTNMIETLTNVKSIHSAPYYYMARQGDDRLIFWDSYYSSLNTPPVPVTQLAKIETDTFHCLGLTTNGSVVAWGENMYGLLDVPPGLTNVADITAKYNRNAAVTKTGKMVLWGDVSAMQTNWPAALTNVTQVAFGYNHTLALKADGTVVGWGSSAINTNPPPGLSNVVRIAAGIDLSLALLNNGHVVAWGGNNSGGTNVPPDLAGVTAIAVGDYHCLALKADGTVAAWDPNFGEGARVPTGLTDVTSIAAGAYHSVALRRPLPTITTQSRDQIWDLNSSGSLGVAVLSHWPATYQWYLNQQPIPNATNNTLLFPQVILSQQGTYQMLASNLEGVVWSDPIQITLQSIMRLEGFLTNGRLHIQGDVPSGNYSLEISTDLKLWQTLLSTNSTGSLHLVDPEPANRPQRYYRLRREP